LVVWLTEQLIKPTCTLHRCNG